MSARRNCIHQGFAYAKNGYKDIHIVCDWDGECHSKKYCEKCENYVPHTRPSDKFIKKCEREKVK